MPLARHRLERGSVLGDEHGRRVDEFGSFRVRRGRHRRRRRRRPRRRLRQSPRRVRDGGGLRAGWKHVKRPERLRDDRRRVPRGGRQGIRGERETPHRADSPLGGAPTVFPSPSPPRILPLFSLLFLLILLLLGHDLVRVPDLVAAQRLGSVHVLVRVVPLEHADAESLPACRPDGSEAPGVRVPSHRPRLRHLAKLLGALEGVVPDAVQVRLRVKDVARGVVDERGCGLSPSAPSAPAVFVVNVAFTVAVAVAVNVVACPTAPDPLAAPPTHQPQEPRAHRVRGWDDQIGRHRAGDYRRAVNLAPTAVARRLARGHRALRPELGGGSERVVIVPGLQRRRAHLLALVVVHEIFRGLGHLRAVGAR